MQTHVFQIQNIFIRRIHTIARDFDDAARLLSDGFSRGIGGRPEDADFDVVLCKIGDNSPALALRDWAEQGLRGIAWPYGGEQGWRLVEP